MLCCKLPRVVKVNTDLSYPNRGFIFLPIAKNYGDPFLTWTGPISILYACEPFHLIVILANELYQRPQSGGLDEPK